VLNFSVLHPLAGVKENKVGATIISKYAYAVNAVNQRDGVATSGSAFTSASSVAWGYDALGQVVAADEASGNTNDFGYEYDRMGNRKKSSRGTTAVQASSGAMRATYRSGIAATSLQGGNSLNQYGRLDFYGAATILNNTYDDDGNQIEGRFPTTPSTSTQSGNTRAWDGENQLISTTVNTGGTPNLYTYDAYHRRVAKRTNSTDVTYTVYDGWNPVAEYTRPASTFVLQTSYTWGKDLSGSMQGAGGVGGLLAVQKYSGTTGTYLPTYDGNGNVSEYLSTTGAIVAHYEYGPFGEQTVASGPQAADFKHRFSTKPLDAESGYYYYGYRSYDPLSGRWVNRDPIGERGGASLYAMVGNNLLSQYDLFGLIPNVDGGLIKVEGDTNCLGAACTHGRNDVSAFPQDDIPLSDSLKKEGWDCTKLGSPEKWRDCQCPNCHHRMIVYVKNEEAFTKPQKWPGRFDDHGLHAIFNGLGGFNGNNNNEKATQEDRAGWQQQRRGHKGPGKIERVDPGAGLAAVLQQLKTAYCCCKKESEPLPQK
jgi:RHS repeat-associated protein